MSSTIKRQKIVEREKFNNDEKIAIARKSADKCCCCGKTVFFGYGATVEHFVPLSKGGTNRSINLVMLCSDCNQKKGDFIYWPDDYLSFIKEPYLNELKGYFNSYIKSFDFVNRDNLLACDRYKVFVAPNENIERKALTISNKKKRDQYMNILKKKSMNLWVKRASLNDVDKLTEYYIKYLKKYNCLDAEEAARINIEFWINFGCIYYVEKHNEIKSFITITVTDSNDKVFMNGDPIKNFLTINVFSYYDTEMSLTLAYNLSRQIPKYLCSEQNLVQLPVQFGCLKYDKLCTDICSGGTTSSNERFMYSFIVLCDTNKIETLPNIAEDENLNNFFNRFANVNRDKIDDWFKNHDSETYEWMLEELALNKTETEE